MTPAEVVSVKNVSIGGLFRFQTKMLCPNVDYKTLVHDTLLKTQFKGICKVAISREIARQKRSAMINVTLKNDSGGVAALFARFTVPEGHDVDEVRDTFFWGQHISSA